MSLISVDRRGVGGDRRQSGRESSRDDVSAWARDGADAADLAAPVTQELRSPPLDARAPVGKARLRAGLVACDVVAVMLALGLSGMTGRAGPGFAVLSLLLLTVRTVKLAPKLMDELPQIVARTATAAVAALLLLVEDGGSGSLLALASTTAVTVILGRAVAYRIIRYRRRRLKGLQPVVIVGTGAVALELAAVLRDHREYGLEPLGFVDSSCDSRRSLPLPLLGGLTDLESVVAAVGARRVVVAYSGLRDSVLADTLRSCLHLRVEVYQVPRFFELGIPIEGRWADEVWGIPLSRMGQSALRTVRCKRLFDLLVALAMALVTAPLMLLCAAAVRVSSPGPVLFRQRRVGKNGREFDVLKFRSMRVNDDSATTWTVAGDGRRTRIGRLLRSSSLDELPQLLNVVRGEMSIVGPRPERPFFVQRFSREIPHYRHRHRIPPGITGLAQVHGLRGDTSIAERTRYDNRYIDNWSLWRDVAIILRTVRTMLPGQAR